MTPLGIILTMTILVPMGIIALGHHMINRAKSTQHLFSDADIFKLMNRSHHFLTPKQLANRSPLSEKEATTRLIILSSSGAIHGHMDKVTWVTNVFQLKESLPLSPDFPIQLQGLSDQEVISKILHYVPNYQVTVPELVLIFGIDVYEAQALLKRLQKGGVVKRYRRWSGYVYVISDPLKIIPPMLRKEQQKISIAPIAQSGKIVIPDTDILALAIKNKGTLTPTRLCLDMRISLEDAAEKLDELHEKGVFTIDINEENTVMEYHLLDKSLLKD